MYRGYRLVDNVAGGYIEIWARTEIVDCTRTVAEARDTIDGWHDAR